nr:hypothetical protein [Mucilaginibacter sp. X5P1]
MKMYQDLKPVLKCFYVRDHIFHKRKKPFNDHLFSG